MDQGRENIHHADMESEGGVLKDPGFRRNMHCVTMCYGTSTHR